MKKQSNNLIHSSAVIEDGADIATGCFIGPFCVVGSNVSLKNGVRLISHVNVSGTTEIGEETVVWPFASIGHDPQDLKYVGEKTSLLVGKRNKIREGVSINTGTKGGTGITKIGDDCLFMLGSHVGHDCNVGNGVVVANHGSIAGHVVIEDKVTIGGLSGIHQFCRIGEGAMIGAVSMVTNDVIPYSTVIGERATLAGLNLVGLKRRGVSSEKIKELRNVYSLLFGEGNNLRSQAEAILNGSPKNEFVRTMVEFILSDTNRSFLTPKF
jgi:UDP-N-acetylglucosamine acyltransferase